MFWEHPGNMASDISYLRSTPCCFGQNLLTWNHLAWSYESYCLNSVIYAFEEPWLCLLAPTGALEVAPLPLFHITSSRSSKIWSVYACIYSCQVNYKCWLMLIDMLIDAVWCWQMLTDADWCWLIPVVANWFWLVLIDADWMSNVQLF